MQSNIIPGLRSIKAGDTQVLVCTDAAAEGLNFQFCGALINFDCPWNPMRVEQRIGRVDCLGQRFGCIAIVNLMYEGTVETNVYRVSCTRINLFTAVVGRLQPILSTMPQRIAAVALTAPDGRAKARANLIAIFSRKQLRQRWIPSTSTMLSMPHRTYQIAPLHPTEPKNWGCSWIALHCCPPDVRRTVPVPRTCSGRNLGRQRSP